MKFNLNHYVKVKLTDRGKTLLIANDHSVPEADADGWTKWQLWHLMQCFGEHMYNGCRIPFETEIEIIEGQGMSFVAKSDIEEKS